jgi:hypothetical protein
MTLITKFRFSNWNVVPFGLKNMTSMCTPWQKSFRVRCRIFWKYLWIIQTSTTQFDNNIWITKLVLTCLKDVKLKYNLSKCVFASKEIKVLGLWLVKHGWCLTFKRCKQYLIFQYLCLWQMFELFLVSLRCNHNQFGSNCSTHTIHARFQ